MLSKLIQTTVALSLVASVAFAAQGVMFNVVSGDKEAEYNSMVNEKIESIGWILSDPHERINDAYEKRYGNPKDPDYDKDGWKVTLDNLGFFSVANDAALRPLLIKAPELGGFSPFNLHVYKLKNEDKTYVGHIVPDTMLDIVGVKDAGIRKEFNAMFPSLDKMVQDEIGGKVETSTFDGLPSKPMMNFELKFDRPAELADFIETFQENYEAAFEEKKYIIAGYKDFKETYTDLELAFDEYDAYFVYSLCHFTYSYNMFNKGRPDAGAFAPCSMYLYIKKDSNTMVIGMPKLANWVSVLNIKDAAMKKSALDLDKEIISIMKGLGAKEI
jgi:uncharacterized protein (DUF302 family)